jgi:hypothetical protein
MPVSKKRKNRKRRPVQVPTQVQGARARRQPVTWSAQAIRDLQRVK